MRFPLKPYRSTDPKSGRRWWRRRQRGWVASVEMGNREREREPTGVVVVVVVVVRNEAYSTWVVTKTRLGVALSLRGPFPFSLNFLSSSSPCSGSGAYTLPLTHYLAAALRFRTFCVLTTARRPSFLAVECVVLLF